MAEKKERKQNSPVMEENREAKQAGQGFAEELVRKTAVCREAADFGCKIGNCIHWLFAVRKYRQTGLII